MKIFFYYYNFFNKCFFVFVDQYMDNSSGGLGTHDSWSALQIPNSGGMGTLAHTTNTTSNTR